MVAPTFDGRKAVLFDDRWASAREDLARLWLLDEEDIDTDWSRLSERFEGAGHIVAAQASWWQGKALAAGRNVHATLYGRAAAGAENPEKGGYANEIAVVTGASKGSIAASVAAQLLNGGATVIATTSKLDDDRLAFYRTLYRDNARFGGQLWVVPANMASYTDIDALIEWVGNEQSESLGPQSIHLKDALTPTLLFPFAAPRVAGDLSDAGARSEMEMKVLLWAVQRLIGGLSHLGSERDIASRLHVVLPGSPNRGMFGGDGAYGESKSALDAVVARWKAEAFVGATSLVGTRADRLDQGHRADGSQRRHRRCGRRGRRHDVLDRARWRRCCLSCATSSRRSPPLVNRSTRTSPVGSATSSSTWPNLPPRRGRIMAAKAAEGAGDEEVDELGTIAALPSPPRGYRSAPPPAWADLDVDPDDLVVIVGGAELGPYGSSRTRFEVEVAGELSAAGVLELAWTTGLVKWEDDPEARLVRHAVR